MIIKKWGGLISAASPYALPAGAATEQSNLQIRKPGQLITRTGMEFIRQANTGAVLGLHRQSPGGSQSDRMLSFCILDEPTAGTFDYALQNLTLVGNSLTADTVYTVTSTSTLRPSFALDRHGTVYVFFGNGISPRTYRYSVSATSTESFGMDAPTVAPAVSPSGDGWFIERVDVLQSGTSYFAAPSITVTPATINNNTDTPTRDAKLKAVVQAGQIVAVDVVDGGSNYRAVPKIEIDDNNPKQIGVGFIGRGVRSVASAVYGFLDSTAVKATYPQGSLSADHTHSYFDPYSQDYKIAYKSGATTAFVTATFDPVAVLYTALIPLTPQGGSVGKDAFAEVKLNPVSAAFKLGTTAPDYQTSVQDYQTAAGTTIRFRAVKTNWYTGTGSNYFENTFTTQGTQFVGIAAKYTYNSDANKDAFWGLMPNPGNYKFAKRQIRERWYDESSGIFDSGNQVQQWGNYFFPDYDWIGYRLLVGPENGLSDSANWEVGRAQVQRDGNGLPFIDITLKAAKKSDGTAYATQAGTTFPKARFFLKDCPEGWTVDNEPLPNTDDDWRRRYNPQTGQDRRLLFADTQNPTTTNESGTLIEYSLKDLNSTEIAQLDTATRWWGAGHAAGLTQARPIVDFRTTSAGDTTGIGGGTVEIVNATPGDNTTAIIGSQLERGTKFVVRFEQYNAADYRVVDKSKDFGWLSSTSNQSNYPTYRTVDVADMPRRGSFGAGYTDFYFEANALDSTGSNVALLLPGSVSSAKVTVSGTGWASASEDAEFTLRQRSTTPPASPTTTAPYGATYTDSVTYRWQTVQVIAATTAQRIDRVEIKSAGLNYFREPTILFKGGGGYGLKVQSTVSNGNVTSVAVIDGGDGFTSDTELYTDVQPAKLLPVMRGTMRGIYRCAYRYADYRQTVILNTTVTTTSGSTTATLASTTGVKPDMQITGAAAVPHLARIVSVSGTTITLSKAATATATTQACVIRDMSLPVIYSDFSPIVDVDADSNGGGRASQLNWTLPGVVPPTRAEYVEFFRTSADQSLVFYRLDQYGVVANGTVTIQGSDTLSDEELFDIERPGYAALPVVLPNGGLNAFRFGTARNDMSVAVAWQDRLWYGVSTSGLDSNTVFFSEYDEFESCPDINEIPIQNNLPSTDYLTALVPFGSVLMAMQSSHCYSIGFNTDPSIDAIVTLAAHRGCLSQRAWDIFDEKLYAADERGVYAMSKNGEVESLSDTIRDFFDESRIDFAKRNSFHLRVDQRTNILRLWVSLAGQSADYPTMALCYHIENEVWWTENWPNSITASTYYRPASSPDLPVYGAIDGCIYQFSGLRDYTNRDLKSVTVTNGGSGYTSAPTVTASGGKGAELRAIIRDGVVQEVLVVKGGYGYGTVLESGFNSAVSITFSGGGGSSAAATGVARDPNSGTANDLPIRLRTTVPYTVRTGPLELMYEGNARGGDGLVDRSITVTYQPLESNTTLNLREYYNNSPTPRSNLMRRDRGTGFVHDTSGAKTTLNMAATRSTLGLSTGLAKAQFAGRSMDDIGSADRHIAVELSGDAEEVQDNATVSRPLIYALEVRGVQDGS